MEEGEKYWSLVEPVWDVINIYDGPVIFLQTLGEVRREIGLLYAAHFCASEIWNGGFEQFFDNSTGVLAPEAIEAFATIGQLQVSEIIKEASRLMGKPYPRDRERRQAVLEQFAPGTFDDFDESFYSLIGSDAGGFYAAADRYAACISEHKRFE